MLDGNIWMVFVKQGFKIWGFCPSLDECDGAIHVVRASRVKKYVVREQSVHASSVFGAKRKMLDSSVPVGE